MKLATQKQVQNIDQLAQKKFGLSMSTLVEAAGLALSKKFLSLVAKLNVAKTDRIAIWCGPGNNGADGKIMAKHLQAKNYSVEIVEGTDWNIQKFSVIIDALFGVGLNRQVDENFAIKIQQINQSSCIVVSIDIPSGLSADNGVVMGSAIKAAVTLTIYPPKPGLFLNQGPEHAGQIQLVKIGIPAKLFQEPHLIDTYLVDRKFACQLLPSRKATANKTHFGHLLVVAGSEGMEGAAALVCEAAARMGCGYVTLCSLSRETYRQAKPDFLQLSEKDFLSSDLKKYNAVVIGPGLGSSLQSWQLLQHLLKSHKQVLVDADGLNLLAAHQVSPLPEGWILTPHAGELSRLLGLKATDLEADRLQAVLQAQKTLNCSVLLKGFRTVLRAAGKNFVIYSGNVGLAKAGSGDVLSGFIGSLMAQGLSAGEAAACGAYLHGRIADDWLRQGGTTRTLMASDLPQRIDATLRSLKKPQ
jgi:hydroxyethylthiazole kinase-like uncharacterized protein yjeF